MTSSLLTIADHPTDPIEIDCQKCGRHGRYRKATLIEIYSDDTVLPDLLALLTNDCEFRNKLGNQGCEAIYPASDMADTEPLPKRLHIKP